MMQGVVNQRCEATLPLVVGNANGQRQVIDAVIDTGFNGFLTLSSSIITALEMSLLYKYGLRIDAVEGGIVRVEAL